MTEIKLLDDVCLLKLKGRDVGEGLLMMANGVVHEGYLQIRSLQRAHCILFTIFTATNHLEVSLGEKHCLNQEVATTTTYICTGYNYLLGTRTAQLASQLQAGARPRVDIAN